MPIRKSPLDGDFVLSPGRLLALDIGSKRVGIAVCDPGQCFASPLCTLERQRFLDTAKSLETLIDENGVHTLVAGLPFNMDGSEGPRCQATRDFITNFLKRCDIDVIFWDERLSSFTAERMMIQADLSRRHRARHIDQVAAAVILQNFLDYLRLANRPSP